MSLYDVDYVDLIDKMLPIKYRKPKMKAWLYALLKPVEWLHKAYITWYKDGSPVYPFWDSVTSYVYGDYVRYGQSIYFCEIDNTGILPYLSSDQWSLVVLDRIGVNERIRITGQKKILEYELNRRFDTVFSQIPGASEIFILNQMSVNVFVVGLELNSSAIYRDVPSDGIFDEPSLVSSNALINVIDSVRTGQFGGDATKAELAIRNEVDKYLMAGIDYTVVFY